MKKSILNKILFAILLVFISNNIFAQLHIVKDFHIANGSLVYVKGLEVQFGTAASTTTTTTRTATTYGKLWMDVDATLATINGTFFPTSSHFMDGYVRSNEASQFLYPVGQTVPVSGTPTSFLGIAATIGSNTDPIDVAYRRAAASSATTTPLYASPLSSSSISGVEFWHIIGTSPARVSLTYESTRSNFSGLGITAVSDIGIAGRKKSNNTWELIPSTIGNGSSSTSILTGTSVLASGSITTDANVNLNDYDYFTIAKKGCFSLPTSAGTVVWNGSGWSNTVGPDETLTAQIDALYNGPSFTCNAILLNANIDLTGAKYINCVGGVTTTNSAKIIMDANSNFFQRTTGATAPNIEYTVTIPNKRLQDWTYFGAPITDGEITSMATATSVNSGSAANAYGSYRIWNSGVSELATNWVTATDANVVPGKGFIARVRYQLPFLSHVTLSDIKVKFSGLANNQDINFPASSVAYTPATHSTTNNSSTVLLGNPYPSTLDASDFIRSNPNITGDLYFWTSKTVYVNQTGGFVSTAGQDFTMFNLSGGLASGSGVAVPNGFIAVGQGFNVRTQVANGDIFFNNCMREFNSTNPIFYRNASENSNNEKNRYWINLSNSQEEFYNESLVAYLPETTLGYDRMYDGYSSSNSEYTLTSLLNNEKYAIQSRSSFVATDVVPLNVKKASTYNGNLIISLRAKEGIFNQDDVTIFLHDTELNIFHNLEVSPYSFTMNELESSTRFRLVYQSSALNNPSFDLNTVNITLFDKDFQVNSKDIISNITIYDISGRIVDTFKNINNTNFNSNFNHEDGIYIAKVILNNGNVISQKITNLNK